MRSLTHIKAEALVDSLADTIKEEKAETLINII